MQCHSFSGFVKIYPFAKTYITCSLRSIPLGKSISLYPFYGNRNTHLFSLQIGRNLWFTGFFSWAERLSPHGSIRSFWCQIVRLFAETYPHRYIRTYQLDFSFVSSLSVKGNTSTITSFPYYIPNRGIAPSLQPGCSAECMVFSSSQPISLQYCTTGLCSYWFWYNRKSPLRGKSRRKRLEIRTSEVMRWLWNPCFMCSVILLPLSNGMGCQPCGVVILE